MDVWAVDWRRHCQRDEDGLQAGWIHPFSLRQQVVHPLLISDSPDPDRYLIKVRCGELVAVDGWTFERGSETVEVQLIEFRVHLSSPIS